MTTMFRLGKHKKYASYERLEKIRNYAVVTKMFKLDLKITEILSDTL